MKKYIDNDELREEVMKSKAADKLTPRTVELFTLLVSEIQRTMFSYKDDADRKDCSAQALYALTRYWRSYDPAKSPNAFAYFTQAVKTGLARGLRVLKVGRWEGTISIDETGASEHW